MKRSLILAAILLDPHSWAIADSRVPAEVRHDFDRDGYLEKLISTGVGKHEIWRQDQNKQGEWTPADYNLPDGVAVVDGAGHDLGLRFVDLNGDGFDDVLFSNSERYAIHLWNKNVQPHLGWTKGWTQFVRAGERHGATNEPPDLVGAEVRVSGDELIVVHAATAAHPEATFPVSLKQLIAFDMTSPRSPEDALASFRLRPGFRIELMAAEPVVVDPIAFDWSADGRLWVVEMRDYPLGMDGHGKPGGRIVILADRDGDGRYDHATPFLEDIGFPSSIMAWRKGVLVAAAPDIFYAEDTNGDGRADVRTVLFTGFTPGNQQHRVNGFAWGMDGWVYLANGDSDGRVRSVATGQVLDIRGRDFRCRPDTGEMETVSGRTQYGLRRDDWDNWFGNNNPAWLWHVALPEHYLRRNPNLAVKRVVQPLANYPDSTSVYPASPPMLRPNQPWSLNHVTSGCSPCPYRDDLFGPAFATSVFVSEPVHNVVHREVLTADGPSFQSRRDVDEEQTEFLASTDNWFRPTSLRVGPDGALWIADMYRFILEHPEWISPELQARIDLRAGSDRGRIYRVVPEGKPRRPIPDLSKLDSAELAGALNSPNGWQRDTVQRLLAERGDPSPAPALRGLLTLAHIPQVRVQALATLGLLGALTTTEVQLALGDPHPGVRCEALRQSERFARDAGELFGSLSLLAADPVGAVRLQAAFTLGAWPAAEAEPVLASLVFRATPDEWLRMAVMSSLRPDSDLFKKLRANEPIPEPASSLVKLRPSSPDRAQVLAQYSEVGHLTGDSRRGQRQFQLLCSPCHKLRNEGHEVGPALDMVGMKPVEWLLAAILDPNQAIEARYRAWSIKLKSQDELTGLIVAETANNLVVKAAGGIERAILREELGELHPSKVSLMPEGFESALKPQDMADLLSWLPAR